MSEFYRNRKDEEKELVKKFENHQKGTDFHFFDVEELERVVDFYLLMNNFHFQWS
jgi:hypothetical protein